MDFIIAVDGPAASGKGTVAIRLAAMYQLPYLDTGLLYRAVGYSAAVAMTPKKIMGDGYGRIDTEAAEYRDWAIVFARSPNADNLEDVRLRSNAAGELASRVAVIPEVREGLLDYQRAFAARAGGAVLDGRDIGTVIAPDAPAKLFVTARPEVRATRRWRQLASQGEAVAFDDVLADILRRDERDSGRASAPLVQAADAILLDTSEMDISASVEAARRIVEEARARWEQSRSG